MKQTAASTLRSAHHLVVPVAALGHLQAGTAADKVEPLPALVAVAAEGTAPLSRRRGLGAAAAAALVLVDFRRGLGRVRGAPQHESVVRAVCGPRGIGNADVRGAGPGGSCLCRGGAGGGSSVGAVRRCHALGRGPRRGSLLHLLLLLLLLQGLLQLWQRRLHRSLWRRQTRSLPPASPARLLLSVRACDGTRVRHALLPALHSRFAEPLQP